MTKKMNARQLREQQKIAEKEKYARKAQLERERKKEEEAAREAEIAAEKRRRRIEAICKEMNENNEPIKSDKKSSAKAAGVKSVFAVDDAVYMTSFGRGNDAVLEKKIISGSHENINCDEPAFTLTNVAADKYEIESSRVKSLNATSDNPVHHGNDQPNAVFSDMLELKSPLETRVYGKTFDNDNIHIQLIYNILDIEKILALYSTNAIYALNNLLNKNDQTDIFERMMTDNTYKEICDPPEDRYKANRQELKAFMDSLIKNPRLAYYGTAFYIPNDNKSVLRSEKEIYDILALLGKLRHWCIHGNESNRKWLYSLDDNDFLAPEFKKIMDKLYDGAIDKLNKDFVKTNKVNIQILEAIFSNEDHAELVQEYYDFLVTKKYKNIGFSIKKLREDVIANTDIRDNKYDSVRPKLYKLIDFIIWHRYLHDDAAEADRLVNELRGSEDNAYKELIYIEESERLWDKCSDDILNKVVPAIDKENIKDLTESSLDEVSIDIIKGSKEVSCFTKLMYLLTLFIDGKEINDLLTTLINKFDNIRSLNETMEMLGLHTEFIDEYKFFADSAKIFKELTELNSFAKMCSVDVSAKRVMYIDALDILGIEQNMSQEEFDKFLDKILCLDSNGKIIKVDKEPGLRNFIASNVIDSTRFRYLVRYGDPKRIRKAANCEPAVRFVLNSIPEEQIKRYYCSCKCLNLPDVGVDEQRDYLAGLINEMSFEKIKDAGRVQDKNADGVKKDSETKRKYQAVIRIYLTVMYLMLKNLVNVNARYVIGFHCLERDAALYGIKLNNGKYRTLTVRLMGLTDALSPSGEIKADFNVESGMAEGALNRHLRNKRWYGLIVENLKHSDSVTVKEFRNNVAHLNAIRNIDENIKDISYVDKKCGYYSMYHYIIQRHLQKHTENPGKYTKQYFDNINEYKTYCSCFVKAYCTPLAYNLVRYKNLTISGQFDKNIRSDEKEKEKEKN